MPVDISALEQAFTQTPRGPSEMVATGVVPALAAAVVRTHFGEELAFPRKPTTVKQTYPTSPYANAEYNLDTGDISIDPGYERANQPAYMKKNPALGGYIGTDAMPTTANVLNYVQTLRHELMHARTPDNTQVARDFINLTQQQAAKEKTDWRDKSAKTETLLNEAMLPSMGSGMNLTEFLATAIPLQSAEKKFGLTSTQSGLSKQQETMAEVQRVLNRSPVLQQLMDMWQRPELRSKK